MYNALQRVIATVHSPIIHQLHISIPIPPQEYKFQNINSHSNYQFHIKLTACEHLATRFENFLLHEKLFLNREITLFDNYHTCVVCRLKCLASDWLHMAVSVMEGSLVSVKEGSLVYEHRIWLFCAINDRSIFHVDVLKNKMSGL